MNAYIEDCYRKWKSVNAWFFRILWDEVAKIVVEVCRNE